MKSIKAIVGDSDITTVDVLTTVADAARLMTARHIGAVPVLDGSRLAGIFSERDMMGRVVAVGLDPEATIVGDVMSTGLIVAEVGESYEVCLQRMQQAHVRHLLVLDSGKLAGVVSLRDLLAVELDEKDEALTLLNAYVHYVPADLQAKPRS